jgi:RimJ/RimL family protein N-acetyltransferase
VPVSTDHVTELRRIAATPEVSVRWGREDVKDPDWPHDDPWATPFAIVIDGVVRGLIQYGEETGPMYRYASIDIFLEAAVHGRGHGREAIARLARYLIDERGHHRLTIDPAADNQAAIRCYEAVGFRPVGIMRSYEHDVDGPGWHDGLLMEMLADELRLQPAGQA